MAATEAPPARPKRSMAVRVGKKLRPWVNRTIARWSGVPDEPLLDPGHFAWTAALREHWPAIRAETEAVLRHREAVPPLDEISPDHARIAAGGRWQSFFLYGYGYRFAENCDRAPVTASLVARVPGLNSAFFSILAPGCHIPPHKGVTKAILTCHLGLIVPEPTAEIRMRVEDRMTGWREGECLIFDDSREHEVWNDTAGTRVVLLLQFRRPAALPGRLLGTLFLAAVRRTAFVQDARRNLAGWDEAMRRAEAAD